VSGLGRDVNEAVVPAIELIDATKRYGDQVALDRVSLDIAAGEFFCLLGPSGCGKTTTLNLIGGFLPLTSGELRIEGRRVNELPPHRRNVNTVFQSYALFPHLTVADNVAFGLKMERLPRDEVRRRVGEYLELVGLAALADRLPAQLSGGQQQRVALARALAKRPAVLLLDEPLGALDLKLRKQMQVELSRIHRQVGTTFVFVTHDQGEALSMATRIAVMDRGLVVQSGTPRDIYYRPVSRFVADFIGESNLLDGREVGPDGDLVRVEVAGGCVVLAAPGTDRRPTAEVSVMVRPESLRVEPDGQARGRVSSIRGRVVDVGFRGDHTRVTVRTAAGDIVSIRPHAGHASAARLEALLDQEVDAWWSASDATVIGR
jgi:spermidine/putrescine transport system ATP-binding protein